MAGESEDDVDALDVEVNREREGETNRIVRNLLAGRPDLLEYAQVFEDSMIAPYNLKNLNAQFLFREMGVPLRQAMDITALFAAGLDPADRGSRSLRKDPVCCSTWEKALEAADAFGFPVELSIRNGLAPYGMEASRSSISLRRTAHSRHEIQGVVQSMFRVQSVLSVSLARRRNALGPKATERRVAPKPQAQVWVDRLRGAGSGEGRRGAESEVDYEGKKLWDPRIAQYDLMPGVSNPQTKSKLLIFSFSAPIRNISV